MSDPSYTCRTCERTITIPRAGHAPAATTRSTLAAHAESVLRMEAWNRDNARGDCPVCKAAAELGFFNEETSDA